MINSIVLIVSGLLLIIIPHFVLPLKYLETSTGANILTDCFIWFHPEIYLGVSIIISGLTSIRFKIAKYLAIFISILSIIHSFTLKPVSYYLRNVEELEILANTTSIRSHKGIGYIIALLSITVFLSSIISLLRQIGKKTIVLSLFHLAFSNVRQKMFRSLSIITAISIIIGVSFLNLFITQSIKNTVALSAERIGADLIILPEGEKEGVEQSLLSSKPVLSYLKEDVLIKLKQFSMIEKISPQFYIQALPYKIEDTIEYIFIYAYDPLTDFTITPWIKYSIKSDPHVNKIVVGKMVKFYPGQEIDFLGKNLTVVSTLDPTGIDYFDNSAFISIELIKRDKNYSFDTKGISAITVKVKERTSLNLLRKKLLKSFNDISILKLSESIMSVKRHLTSTAQILYLPVAILLFMGTIILTLVFSMEVNERGREIGLLRAMGAKKKDVFSILVTEAIILTFLGGLFGIISGSILLFIFKNNIMAILKLIYIWPSPEIVFLILFFTIITSISIGIVASLYPAIKASKMEPYLAIRSSE